MDFWAEQTAKCLSCGACTYMCPTCQCFNISDEGDPLEGRRLRSWDNCMSPLFTREASGHNPRTAKALRMRNRVSHKYWYAPDYSDGVSPARAAVGASSSARCRWTSVKLSSTPSRMTRKPNKESEHGRDAQSPSA